MEKSYTNLLQLFKNPIPIKVKKIQKKYTREIAAKQYKVQEYGHPTRKLEKNKGILPSNKSVGTEKSKSFMPSEIGPPIIRWKEKKKQKHQYLLYQTKHHSHQLIIKYSCYVVILCHYS